MDACARIQAMTRKKLRLVSKDDSDYPDLRRLLKTGRKILRVYNKNINRYYDFCDRYPELKKFGHI